MKKSLYWKFLSLVLLIVCFFGCGESDDFSHGSNPVSVNNSSNNSSPMEEDNREKPPDIEDILAELEIILVELEAILEENNENVPEDDTLVRDVESPKMIDANIEDGAQDVTLASVIWIKFDEPIDTADVSLDIKGGETVETRVIFRHETIEIRRLGRGKDFHLKPLTTYVIEGMVADAAGNETEVEMTFTTGEVIFPDGF